MNDSLGLIGREKVHYEAIERLRDLSILPPNLKIDDLVRHLADTIEDWNKMMGGKSILPGISEAYVRKIRNEDQEAGRRLYFYLSPIIFYVQALHEASKASWRNAVTKCGMFGERIVKNLLFAADRCYSTKVSEEMVEDKFENKNGRLKSILELNHFAEADELHGSLKKLYSMRNKTGPHDVPPPEPIQAKISINECLSAYLEYLHALIFLGVDLRDDMEDFLSFFNKTTQTQPTLIFGEETTSVSARDFIKQVLYRESFFQGGKSLTQVMSEMESRRYRFNKPTVSNDLKFLSLGKEAILNRKSVKEGFVYFERVPPLTYFKTVL